jgi:hypothetical protein
MEKEKDRLNIGWYNNSSKVHFAKNCCHLALHLNTIAVDNLKGCHNILNLSNDS